uniref:Protein KTI12 homolog n=1 Tax=Steinernema glaseri TaxID=37863 RepID=A0A1I7ZMB1_9BILA
MPFLLVTGGPASGKTTIVERIVEHFKANGYKGKITIVKDSDFLHFSRSNYNDSHKEREHRNFLRSTVQKELTKDSLVICDSLNYIKGFRYELFCIGKLVQTTYAVVHCDAAEATCSWLNEQKPEEERYSEPKIGELLMRYERPEGKNRWDSPLYVVKVGRRETTAAVDPEDMNVDFDYPSPRFVDVPLDDIYSWLVEGKALSANLSTQSAPLAKTNFLHDLDRVTQEIVAAIMEQQRMAVPGDRFLVPHVLEGDEKVRCHRPSFAFWSLLYEEGGLQEDADAGGAVPTAAAVHHLHEDAPRGRQREDRVPLR